MARMASLVAALSIGLMLLDTPELSAQPAASEPAGLSMAILSRMERLRPSAPTACRPAGEPRDTGA